MFKPSRKFNVHSRHNKKKRTLKDVSEVQVFRAVGIEIKRASDRF